MAEALCIYIKVRHAVCFTAGQGNDCMVRLSSFRYCLSYCIYIKNVANAVCMYLRTVLQIVPMNNFGIVKDELCHYSLYGFIYWPS